MISRMRFLAYLRLLSTLNCVPFAASAKVIPRRLDPLARKVCLKLTWPMTYLKRPALRSTSPSCWTASTPPLASPSIAKASSLPSPRRSPATTASCAPRRIPSGCVRRPDDSTGRLLGNRRRLAGCVSPIAHLPTCGAASSGLACVFGTTVPVTHHLGQRWPESQLERRVFSAFSLRLAAPGVVSSYPPARPGLLPGTVGGRGRRRSEERRV